MADPIKVKIDLASGLVEVEADSASIETVFSHLNEFLPRLSTALRPVPPVDALEEESDPAPNAAAPSSDAEKRKRAPAKGSSRRETYELVDLALSQDERQELRSYFAEKKPESQNEQTAVLMDWLKREKTLATVDRNQVFTAFRTVEEKVPGKIGSVLGNMVGQGWVVNRGNGRYEITHVAEDHVRLNLPSKPKKK